MKFSAAESRNPKMGCDETAVSGAAPPTLGENEKRITAQPSAAAKANFMKLLGQRTWGNRLGEQISYHNDPSEIYSLYSMPSVGRT
jgi:hypothetical protein